ncbi:uncharacterized protein A1O5_10775 [Cladophialophora psammophila CBS 110553]|uniref:Alpha/beta hydrolase fold-3 domain-containing protein n=1 Tax=Cladophialophora psammophila CBS 110553 TaxID=1182543 RepID=W9X6S7_9EURO|nr:uncharacterized protein A1O5_10775 [Cladophialophora psammophila CBS 110553]EXJ66159.1 hypothetical protein A1O5_10775 [Cladophialophora psammophila CBS 110553]
MVHLISLIVRQPIKFFFFSYTFLAEATISLLKRVLVPHFPRYQSLRTEFQRAYLASASIYLPDIVHRLPVQNCPESKAREVGKGWTGYLVPGSRDLAEFAGGVAAADRKAVVLYVHGGGYARGEARQYLRYYERWIREAAKAGLDLIFLTVEYTLSTEATHPRQRDECLAAYRYLLDEGISPMQILLMGDSAGAALSIMLGLELDRLGLPQPSGTVLISPWLDCSLRQYEGGSPLVATDYVVTANQSVPMMYKMFLGDLPGDSPDVNPLFRPAEGIKCLSPQLILVGGAEFAMQDGRDWSYLCREAGLRHEMVVEWGQLHIFAMGSRWIEPQVRRRTDKKIISWMLACIKSA